MIAALLEDVRRRLRPPMLWGSFAWGDSSTWGVGPTGGIETARWLLGWDKVAQHAAPPRYVWVPRRGRYSPPERAGGNPRQLLTRLAELEVHIWGVSFGDTEARLHDLIRGLLVAAPTSVQVLEEDWDAQSVVERGSLVILRLAVKLPIVDVPKRAARAVTIVPDATDAAPDGVLQWGEE